MAQNDSNVPDTVVQALRRHGHVELVARNETWARRWAETLAFPGEYVTRAFRVRVNGRFVWMVSVQTQEYADSLTPGPCTKRWVEEAALAYHP